MKTLIVFSSKYGTVERCAKLIAEKLGDAVLENLRNNSDIKISDFDTVIIGGSIYSGKIRDEIKEFCTKQHKELIKKRLGLFICNMGNGEKELLESYPAKLLEHALVKLPFGGELNFEKMNADDKKIIKSQMNIDRTVVKILNENIKRFYETIKTV